MQTTFTSPLVKQPMKSAVASRPQFNRAQFQNNVGDTVRFQSNKTRPSINPFTQSFLAITTFVGSLLASTAPVIAHGSDPSMYCPVGITQPSAIPGIEDGLTLQELEHAEAQTQDPFHKEILGTMAYFAREYGRNYSQEDINKLHLMGGNIITKDVADNIPAILGWVDGISFEQIKTALAVAGRPDSNVITADDLQAASDASTDATQKSLLGHLAQSARNNGKHYTSHSLKTFLNSWNNFTGTEDAAYRLKWDGGITRDEFNAALLAANPGMDINGEIGIGHLENVARAAETGSQLQIIAEKLTWFISGNTGFDYDGTKSAYTQDDLAELFNTEGSVGIRVADKTAHVLGLIPGTSVDDFMAGIPAFQQEGRADKQIYAADLELAANSTDDPVKKENYNKAAWWARNGAILTEQIMRILAGAENLITWEKMDHLSSYVDLAKCKDTEPEPPKDTSCKLYLPLLLVTTPEAPPEPTPTPIPTPNLPSFNHATGIHQDPKVVDDDNTGGRNFEVSVNPETNMVNITNRRMAHHEPYDYEPAQFFMEQVDGHHMPTGYSADYISGDGDVELVNRYVRHPEDAAVNLSRINATGLTFKKNGEEHKVLVEGLSGLSPLRISYMNADGTQTTYSYEDVVNNRGVMFPGNIRIMPSVFHQVDGAGGDDHEEGFVVLQGDNNGVATEYVYVGSEARNGKLGLVVAFSNEDVNNGQPQGILGWTFDANDQPAPRPTREQQVSWMRSGFFN